MRQWPGIRSLRAETLTDPCCDGQATQWLCRLVKGKSDYTSPTTLMRETSSARLCVMQAEENPLLGPESYRRSGLHQLPE